MGNGKASTAEIRGGGGGENDWCVERRRFMVKKGEMKSMIGSETGTERGNR